MKIIKEYNPLPILARIAFIVVGLIIVMAVISKYNKNPDENPHFQAVKYYSHHWITPHVADPLVKDSFSRYGYSRLTDREIYYPLAGKFVNIISPIIVDLKTSARFFNVALFIFLVILATVKKEMNVILMLLLFSPQIWYIFSYTNSDALPFSVAMLLVYQFGSSKSITNNYLRSSGYVKNFMGAIIPGVLIGFLLLSKQNYYGFLGFLGIYMIWSIFFGDFIKKKKKYIIKCSLIIVMAILLYVPFYLQDINLYGFSKKQIILNQAEITAQESYKPSKYGTSKSFFGLGFKSKGVKFNDLFTRFNWHNSTYQSFVGRYGYMNIPSTDNYYTARKITDSLLVLIIIYSIIKSRKINYIILMISAIFAIAGVIYLSIYHSWVDDFQAQGRYLFPIIPVLGLLMVKTWDHLPKKTIYSIFLIIALLGIYSFTFTGIAIIPK